MSNAYAIAQIRASLREAAAFAAMARDEDLPQHAAKLLATATASLAHALTISDVVDHGDEVDADYARATARIAEAATALAAACAID